MKLTEKVRSREVKEKNEKYKKAVDELKRLETMQKDLQGRFKVYLLDFFIYYTVKGRMKEPLISITG